MEPRLSHKFIHETFVVKMAVKVVNMSYIAAKFKRQPQWVEGRSRWQDDGRYHR